MKRLCKHTCSPESSLITSVISTSRVFTSSSGAPRKLISCSGIKEEHTHRIRMIEVPSVSHAAWTYCRTGNSFKMLKRDGMVGGVSRIT